MVNGNKIVTQFGKLHVFHGHSKVLDMNGLCPSKEVAPQLFESLTLFSNLLERGLCATRAPPS